MNNLWQVNWTTEVKIESGGRYPLGLNRFHDALEESLIKGVVLAANRLRYFTYSCWIIGDIEENESCKNYAEFVEAFRRRENALALGLYLIKPDYSVSGSDSISSIVNDHIEEYDCTFELMKSNELGVYGLYYAGSIYNWGLTEKDEKGITKLTSSGKKLYFIHNEYCKKSNSEYFMDYKGKSTVPTSVLIDWAKLNDFNNIVEHEEEREFYKSVLFRLDQSTLSDYRCDTLNLFLVCIDSCAKNKVVFIENVLRDINYYKNYYDAERENIYPIKIQNNLQDVHYYWMIYEGHVYFRGWMLTFFEVFLKYLKSNNFGTTIDEFFISIDREEFNSTIKFFTSISKDYFIEDMELILSLLPDDSNLESPMSESNISIDQKHKLPAEILAKFVLVMGSLYKKFKPLRTNKYYQYLIGNLSEDLWFDVLFRNKNFENLKVIDFLKLVLKKYIIEQHDKIMIEKKDLRRTWFTTEDKKYFHEADASIIWRPAKYETLLNFLKDLNLVEYSEKLLVLTEEGRTFLNELILKRQNK